MDVHADVTWNNESYFIYMLRVTDLFEQSDYFWCQAKNTNLGEL